MDQTGDDSAERLRDAREREAAAREILQVISASRDDEGPVFMAILANASRLCDAPLAYLSMVTEDGTHVVSPARLGVFAKFGTTLDNLRVPLSVGVGGLFDHWGANLTRAPLWVRQLGMEWFQILLQQPHKWRRYLVGNVQFLARLGRIRAEDEAIGSRIA